MSNNQNAVIDFLLYSYFGITSDCSEDAMLNASIERAYLDTCRRIRFPSREEFHKNDSKGYYFFTEVSGIIRRQIIEELPNKDYQQWHEDTCKEIIDAGNNPNMVRFYGEPISLTYGHAQKLLNMTMKYLYLLETLLERDYVSCNWNQLHVPIDSYIIEAFDSQSERKTKSILGTDTWSNIRDKEKYGKYQEEIKKAAGNDAPIAWEGPAWIAVAQERDKAALEQKMERLKEVKEKFGITE